MFISYKKLYAYMEEEVNRLHDKISKMYQDKIDELERDQAGRIKLAELCNRRMVCTPREIKDTIEEYLGVRSNDDDEYYAKKFYDGMLNMQNNRVNGEKWHEEFIINQDDFVNSETNKYRQQMIDSVFNISEESRQRAIERNKRCSELLRKLRGN